MSTSTAYTKPRHVKFTMEAEAAGFKVRHYEGRYYYVGPAVDRQDYDDFARLIRATTVPVQDDQMGKHGFVVYPR